MRALPLALLLPPLLLLQACACGCFGDDGDEAPALDQSGGAAGSSAGSGGGGKGGAAGSSAGSGGGGKGGAAGSSVGSGGAGAMKGGSGGTAGSMPAGSGGSAGAATGGGAGATAGGNAGQAGATAGGNAGQAGATAGGNAGQAGAAGSGGEAGAAGAAQGGAAGAAGSMAGGSSGEAGASGAGGGAPFMKVPVRNIPGLESITFYETTGETKSYTFLVNGPELTAKRPDPLGPGNQDITGTSVEFYDVYYSDEQGGFDADGSYLTIAGVFPVPLPAGGGLNLAEISLNYAAGSMELGNYVASFVALGDNAVPGDVGKCIDGDLGTWTTMGNTSGTTERLRLTLGFLSSSGKP